MNFGGQLTRLLVGVHSSNLRDMKRPISLESILKLEIALGDRALCRAS